MAELSETGQAIANARRHILEYLQSVSTDEALSPRLLVQTLAPANAGDPYRAALTSLLASGDLIYSSSWKICLRGEIRPN